MHDPQTLFLAIIACCNVCQLGAAIINQHKNDEYDYPDNDDYPVAILCVCGHSHHFHPESDNGKFPCLMKDKGYPGQPACGCIDYEAKQ